MIRIGLNNHNLGQVFGVLFFAFPKKKKEKKREIKITDTFTQKDIHF